MQTQQTNISAWSGRAVNNHHQTSQKATAQMPSPKISLGAAVPAALHPQDPYAVITPMCKGAARPRPCIDDSSISSFGNSIASSGEAKATYFVVTPMCKGAPVGVSEESCPASLCSNAPSQVPYVITPMCKGAARPRPCIDDSFFGSPIASSAEAKGACFVVTPMCKRAAVRVLEESCLNTICSNVGSITSPETQPPSPYSHSPAASEKLLVPEGQKPSSLNWRAPIFVPAAKGSVQSSRATAVVASDKEPTPISSLRSLL